METIENYKWTVTWTVGLVSASVVVLNVLYNMYIYSFVYIECTINVVIDRQLRSYGLITLQDEKKAGI